MTQCRFKEMKNKENHTKESHSLNNTFIEQVQFKKVKMLSNVGNKLFKPSGLAHC